MLAQNTRQGRALIAMFTARRHFWRNALAILATIAVETIVAAPSIAQSEGSKASRPPIRVEMTDGGRNALCRAITIGLTEWHVRSPSYCGFPMPSDDKDFRLPRWESIDPANNMAIVSEIFYLSNLSIASVGQEDFYRQLHSADILSNLLEQIWPPARPEVERLIVSGKVLLQRSAMDFDHDGKREPVYRMTYVYRPFQFGKPPTADIDYQPVTTDIGIIGHCYPSDLPEGDQLFVYYVRKEDSPSSYQYLAGRHLMPGMNVFYWRGRTYLRDSNEINDPIFYPSRSRMSLNTVCRYRTVVSP